MRRIIGAPFRPWQGTDHGGVRGGVRLAFCFLAKIVGLFRPSKSHLVDSKLLSGFVFKFKVSFFRCLSSLTLFQAESSIRPFDPSLFLVERYKLILGATHLTIEARSLHSGLSLPGKFIRLWPDGIPGRRARPCPAGRDRAWLRCRPGALPGLSGFRPK